MEISVLISFKLEFYRKTIQLDHSCHLLTLTDLCSLWSRANSSDEEPPLLVNTRTARDARGRNPPDRTSYTPADDSHLMYSMDAAKETETFKKDVPSANALNLHPQSPEAPPLR